MGVSALRIAACAGVLVGALILGGCGAGLACADPGGAHHSRIDQQSSKGVNNDRMGLAGVIQRILGQHRKRVRNEAHSRPRVKFGSEPVAGITASESTVATFAEAGEEPAPELAQGDERDGDPAAGTDGGAGTDGVDAGGIDTGAGTETVSDAEGSGGGSDYIDNTVVSAAHEVGKEQSDLLRYPFSYYLLQLRRDGGDWWNADRIIARFNEVISPYLTTPRKPAPEPTPAPAFRGGAPEPEPVLDASGGVAGGGSDYQSTGFGGAPVLTAPIVAVPVPPPAAARFPVIPPAAPPAPGVGSAVARVATAEPGSTGQLTRSTVSQQQQSSESTVRAMSGQTPRQGYTDYFRKPGLPQLAGAALPGVAGILLMTFAGAVAGYRQASAGRVIRASGAARYLP